MQAKGFRPVQQVWSYLLQCKRYRAYSGTCRWVVYMSESRGEMGEWVCPWPTAFSATAGMEFTRGPLHHFPLLMRPPGSVCC